MTQCFEVNVFAPVRLTREFAALLIKARGTVGFTGSVSGVVPFPFSSIYGATKAAIHQYAAMLRLEMKPFGVTVLNVITGGVHTNIADKRDLPSNSWFRVPGIEEAFLERREMAKRNNPMPVEQYARKVVDDFENQTLGGRLNVYRGKMASFLGHLMVWCPRFVVEWGWCASSSWTVYSHTFPISTRSRKWLNGFPLSFLKIALYALKEMHKFPCWDRPADGKGFRFS
ncbi:hypothetical protein JCM33374_g4293 [Metschnikowia sp. JCM 33374]|nr:hypothetical protein JCM33374_g4293 [Metschnikowia sp. JCM 33374]